MASIHRLMSSMTIAAVMVIVVGAGQVEATPIASVDYVDMGPALGGFRYDFTVHNLGDPVADAGFDIFDLFLTFPTTTSLIIDFQPPNWSSISGAGFIDSMSLVPGALPAGGDIAPGQSHGTFVFVFDTRVDNLNFQALFANPDDPANPIVFDGVTAPQAPLNGEVPEPASLLLLTTGVASIALSSSRSRHRRTTKKP